MSTSCGYVEKHCPICGSADTCFCFYGNSNTSDLYCRSCGRTVWEDELHGDASTLERLYLADGSIKETTFEYDENALRLEDLPEEPSSPPRLRERADIWPAEKIKVRILSASDVVAEKVSRETANARDAICALREEIGKTPSLYDEAWEKIATALAEASEALSKAAQSAQLVIAP
jgi:hypothetical protein